MENIFLRNLFSKITDGFLPVNELSLSEKVDFFYNRTRQLEECSLSQIKRVSTKSAEKATEYKKSGNEFFCRGEFIEALKCYTKCAAVAPPNSPELAFAYANRSATLYRLERYEACLVDINRALKENYPETSKPKLLDRKENCLAKLLELKMAEMIHLKLVECSTLDDDTLNAHVRFQLEQCEINNSTDMNYEDKFYLPKVNFKNKTIVNVTEKVGFKYSSEFGRHIVAKKDIKPGEIIAIEKPYASVLSFNKKYSHCANCFVKCESLMPCPNCSSVLFCSKRCLQNAFNCFHRIECQILSLSVNGSPPHEASLDWLVIRLLMTVTKQGKKTEDLMSHPVFKNPLKKPIGEFPDKFKSEDYYNIHSLEDHLDKKDLRTLVSLTSHVPVYLSLLKSTSFFDELCEEHKFGQKDKERYLVHLLVKLLSSRYNAFAVSENHQCQVYPLPPPTANDGSSNIGSALYSFHSIFNHACAMNVAGMFHKDVVVTRAIDPIKAGEQLFMNYGTRYEFASRDARQKFLREEYLFTCRCTPCEENWPLLQNLVSVKSEIIRHKELHQCWKAVEERFAPGILKHSYSAKLYNLLCEFLTLMHEKIGKPNTEYYESQLKLRVILMARGNYYEFARDGILYSL